MSRNGYDMVCHIMGVTLFNLHHSCHKNLQHSVYLKLLNDKFQDSLSESPQPYCLKNLKGLRLTMLKYTNDAVYTSFPLFHTESKINFFKSKA